ncbi:MAG: NADH-quinone oxidoreductase subunit J [Ignavibacteria bacterium]|jgi:NADH-quinone oxidoreductase subunit J|nr:NADH-quinone oxidoreductase subunit J [Ignavibacteria bacterium]HEX2962760.1 NADH-quinone oxidoreductase subunit J [Ignavibacteriales bacterium]MCU7499779.1 NADH-quinone oxidoreductase subunit J [Ignavibacteria bacterium]MCU7513162.1 NADH-quinone oxidoreductase subunit J [Ignavibacteria bacterium]MCU7522050.1 NADH-quinone oxidoreductase subunit J [Ignavibacteria bacterium]
MPLELILFIFFALIAAVSSVVMVTRPNPVMSAIFLVINFFALAGLYLILHAQFIAVVQVIVYAGAIMVLFLFVLMLLNTKSEHKLLSGQNKIKIFAIVLAAFVFCQIAYLVFFSSPSKSLSPDVAQSIKAGTVEEIGKQLYTNYLLPFEAAGFLLLAATVGALVLAKKKFD